jgi:hypothetical protein
VRANTVTDFWAKVNKNTPTGCWEFCGLDNKGYGQFWIQNVVWKAHRFSYVQLIGPIPDDLPLDHLCRNHACVNPAHLEPVTHKENLYRGPTTIAATNRAKTHCPAGHPYDDTNTRVYKGWRICRTCQQEAVRRHRAKEKL